jgi:beta-lactam-binding protein with PASTA domain
MCGRLLTDVVKTCSELRLRLEIINTCKDDTLPEGTVISHIPGANRSVKQHQTVFVTVSEKTEKVVPQLVGLSLEEIRTMCNDLHIKLKTHMLDYPYPTEHCFCQWPAAGSTISQDAVLCYLASAEQHICYWPNYRGRPLHEVTDELDLQGISWRTHEPIKKGKSYFITEQQPKAGVRIEPDHSGEFTAYFQISTKKPSR